MDINHVGPYLAHLSKVPEGLDITEYNGDGEWVKIYSKGLVLNDDGSVFWLPANKGGIPERVSQPTPWTSSKT